MSRLCRSALDCPTKETCCEAGLLSTCVALPPNARCPTVDLAIDAVPGSVPTLETVLVEPLTCESGCLNTTGRHRILHVEARVINRGTSNLLIGAPGAPGVRVAPGTVTGEPVFDCPEYSYAEGLVRLELLGADGGAYSRIDARLSPGCLDSSMGSFGCNFLGLTRDVYSSALGCLGLPIDGVPPGDYTLRFSIDPEARIAESDESNNTFESVVRLTRLDVVSECPTLAAAAARIEADCGWALASAATCEPGELVSLGCPDCTDDPLLRVCEGSEPCLFTNAIAYNDDELSGVYCPKASFTCPAAGSYSSFVKYYRPGTASCTVSRLPSAASP